MIPLNRSKLNKEPTIDRDGELLVCQSVHAIMQVTNKMQLYRLIYYSKSALHVSGDVFAHHQEHLTVFTVSGSVHPSCYRLAAGSNLGEHYQIL